MSVAFPLVFAAFLVPSLCAGEIAPYRGFQLGMSVEDRDSSYNLIRSGDRSSFTLVLYSKKVEILADGAIAEAIRLDTQEAPQREIEKQQTLAAEERVSQEKARSANRPHFRP